MPHSSHLFRGARFGLKNYLIGCPYTGLKNVEKSLHKLCEQGVNVFNAEDVAAINDGYSIEIKGREIAVDSFAGCFLRYPYDLISPHSASYSLREETEFYKSLCFIFDSVNINPLGSTWALRNRVNSLIQLRLNGALVPEFHLMKKGTRPYFNRDCAVKAVGNCYVSEVKEDVTEQQESFLSFEQDGDDFAAVFPASLFSPSQVTEYIDAFGTAFLQENIGSGQEFRCYSVGNQFFIYQRRKIDRFDKSFADYEQTDYELSVQTVKAVRMVSRNFGLKYSCFDVITDSVGREQIIDFNPYGSFPDYTKFPEVSIAAAKVII